MEEGKVYRLDGDYCPYKYKYELENWAVEFYGMTLSLARRHSKAQLYAMFYKESRKGGPHERQNNRL